MPVGIVELSVTNTRRVRRPGIRVHHVGSLPRSDVTVIDAIPVTTVTRTLIDLAGVVPADALEEALDDALRRRLTTIQRLRRRLEHLEPRGRAGVRRLRHLLDARSGTGASESVLETRLRRLLHQGGLPAPVYQYEVRDRGRLLARVDAAYPDLRIAIEVDGYRWHSGRARWERDLRRRNELTSRGWQIIHLTSSDLDRRKDETIRMIAGALEPGLARSPRSGR